MTAKQDHARRQRRQIETTKVDKEDEVSPRKNNQKKTMKIKQDQKKTKLGSKPMAAALSQNIVRAFVNGCSVFGMFGVRGCEPSVVCSGLFVLFGCFSCFVRCFVVAGHTCDVFCSAVLLGDLFPKMICLIVLFGEVRPFCSGALFGLWRSSIVLCEGTVDEKRCPKLGPKDRQL